MDEAKRKRGRPRIYDPDVALVQARDVFWERGFAASSLDDLSAAMSMSRPSLYGAFGDKEALYLKTVERYCEEAENAIRQALDPGRPLREGLAAVCKSSLEHYLSGESVARGCFLIGTAGTEAALNPRVRAVLGRNLAALDHAFEERFRIGRERGELPPTADAAALSRMAIAVMHTLAVRARAGEPRSALEIIAKAGVQMICGDPGPPSKRRKTR